MALLTSKDLQYSYSWTAYRGDNPKVTGNPDNTLLNRKEGYEILYFINKLASIWNLNHKSSGTKMEKMIQEKVPGNIRSQKNIKQWISDHWDDE